MDNERRDDRTRENLKINAFRELAAHWLSGIQVRVTDSEESQAGTYSTSYWTESTCRRATKRNLVGEERKIAKSIAANEILGAVCHSDLLESKPRTRK
jgi:hypothetical protein